MSPSYEEHRFPGNWLEEQLFLIPWVLQRDELCDPDLCPDAPEGGRCDHCQQDKLDAAQTSEAGLVIRRALDARAALNLGIHIGVDDNRAASFHYVILEDERDQLERERANTKGC